MSLMTVDEKRAVIWACATASRAGVAGVVLWSTHAAQKWVTLRLSRADVEAALVNCVIIEDYAAGHRPFPDCLVLGKAPEGRVIHAVVGVDAPRNRILMITVYRPDPMRWSNDFTQRL